MSIDGIEGILERAEVALKRHDFIVALGLFKQALYVMGREPPSPQRERKKAEVLLKILDTLGKNGNWFDALIYVDTIVMIAQSWKDINLEIEANLRATKLLLDRGSWRDAKKRLEKIRVLVNNREAVERRGQWLCYMGNVEWRLGNMEEGKILAQRALNLSLEMGDSVLEGLCLALLAHIYRDMGDFNDAIAFSQDAIDTLGLEKVNEELAQAYIGMGDIYKIKEDYHLALLEYDKCVEIARMCGDYRAEAHGLLNSAECLAKDGALGEAKNRIELANTILSSRGELHSLASVDMVRGIIAFKEEDQATMKNHFSSALAKMEALETPHMFGLFQYEYAKSLHTLGRVDEAKPMFMKALDVFERVGANWLLEKTKKATVDSS